MFSPIPCGMIIKVIC